MLLLEGSGTISICPQCKCSEENNDRFVKRVRRVATDMPEESAGVNNGKTGFVLIVLRPAPYILPFGAGFVLTPGNCSSGK